MKEDKITNLLKAILIFVCYVFYSKIGTTLFGMVGLTDTVSMFISDFLFLIVIILCYKKKLKKDVSIFKENYSLKEKILLIIKWVCIILVINIIMGILTEIFYPELASGFDENSSAVLQLFDMAFVYSIFKTLLFAPIAEELIFKQMIRDVVKNDLAFILISSAIYTAMNFMYASSAIFIDLFGYFMLSAILSLSYLKSHDNIIVVILIKFVYNLLPTIFLILSMIVGFQI